MLRNKDYLARKEELRAQVEALRAQAEELGRQQTEAERHIAQLEREMERSPKRGEDPIEFKERYRQAKTEYKAARAHLKALERAAAEIENVEESLEEVEDEIADAEDDEETEAEFPDLDPIEKRIERTLAILKNIDFKAMEAGIRKSVEHGISNLQAIGFEKIREEMGGRANTLMTRVSDEDLQTLDILVEAGLASSRSECAAMLLHEGIEARKDMIQKVRDTADQIKKLRESMREELRSVAAASQRKTP
jgi:uncharacterized protein YukE